MIEKLRHLQDKLSTAQQDLSALEATEAAFRGYATQQHRLHPNEATGYFTETVPTSETGKRFAGGKEKGWTLEAIKPLSQFAIQFAWRTADMTEKQIAAAVKKLVDAEWQRKVIPLQEAVSYAQAELEAFKAELRELTAAIA